MKPTRNRGVECSDFVRHRREYLLFGGPGQPAECPSPHSCLAGRGRERLLGDDVTQGGARSSLALGYYQAIPTGFQFGSLRSRMTNELGQARRASPYSGGVKMRPHQ